MTTWEVNISWSPLSSRMSLLVTFQVLAATTLKTNVFWCCAVVIDVMVEAVCIFETSVSFCWVTRLNVPK